MNIQENLLNCKEILSNLCPNAFQPQARRILSATQVHSKCMSITRQNAERAETSTFLVQNRRQSAFRRSEINFFKVAVFQAMLFIVVLLVFIVVVATMSGNSRSREFPGIPAYNSRPESRESNLPLAFPFPKMGMEFSICIPVPVNGNEIFLGFPGNFPGIPGNFPFLKVGNGIFYLFQKSFPLMAVSWLIPLVEV